MRRLTTRWTAPALALLVVAAGCDNSDIEGPEDGMAHVSVFLTDAPGDVDAVWLQIEELYLQGDGGRVDLLTEPTDLVLLTDLVGTTQLLVDDAAIDPTTFAELRMVVGDGLLLSSDGTVYVKGDPVLPAELEGAPTGTLQCPSCSQSGLKITVPNDELEVEEGAMAFVLDFDVSQSFGHKAGNSGQWNMHPVIHGTLVGDEDGDGQISDELESVSDIRGTVALAEGVTIPECPAGTARSVEDFIPTATSQSFVGGDGQPIVRTGTVAADGTFQITFLAPDTYTLGFVDTLELEGFNLVFTASMDPTEATVAGDVEGVTYTVQTAECVPAS
ncbi:MAG TPA: DUF4382 domain-containing protein [Longimicrobiales bacterium]|nr:DUF4382 domain-containing protein [Longimicrobiales bacterium]